MTPHRAPEIISADTRHAHWVRHYTTMHAAVHTAAGSLVPSSQYSMTAIAKAQQMTLVESL